MVIDWAAWWTASGPVIQVLLGFVVWAVPAIIVAALLDLWLDSPTINLLWLLVYLVLSILILQGIDSGAIRFGV